MSKWDRKLRKILDEEMSPHVVKLANEIKKFIHGNTTINTEYIKENINEICNRHDLVGSKIDSIEVSNRYKKDEENSKCLKILITVSGAFNGNIYIETGAGYTTKDGERKDIYYVFEYDCKIESDKQNKIKKYYMNIKNDNAEKFIDLVLDRDIYVEYDSVYDSYKVWDKRPDVYEDGIDGSNHVYDERDCFYFYKINKNLVKLFGSEKVRDFASDQLRGSVEKVEWTRYYL